MRSKGATITLAIFGIHLVLGFASSAYAGIVGMIPALLIHEIYDGISGKRGAVEYKIAAASAWIPLALVMEGAALLLLALFFHRRGRAKRG
ncbi:MAG TPA: hypothetical protein VIA62_09465 [Thermoanaerobaculia bacterium]|nr:hypothetical protein [Thermoanaerobaculia bacterium]